MPLSPHLRIDTTALSPDEVAAEIVAQLPAPPRR